VSLARSERHSGIDLVLEGRATVRGTVVDADTGEPLRGFWVVARSGGGGYSRGGIRGQHVSDENGRYVLENAPVGRLRIIASAQGPAEADYKGGATLVTAAGNEVEAPPIQVVKRRIKKTEKAGDLGFEIGPGDPKADPEHGMLVVGLIRPNGPAAATDLRVGDEIASIDGYDVRGPNALYRYGALTRVAPGTTIALGLGRGATVSITAAEPR